MAANVTPPQRKTLLNLAAVGAAAPSGWFETAGYTRVGYTFRLTNTANFTGAGTMVIRGTNFTPQDIGMPAVILFTAADAPLAGANFALAGATGILTVNPSAATGTFSASFVTDKFPQFLQAEWLGGTGGGTVTINVVMTGW